jgi:hypothetical protein
VEGGDVHWDENAMTPDDIPGVDVRLGDDAQAGVEKLVSNRTLIVEELNKNRAEASSEVEVFDVKDLSSAVETLQPKAGFVLQDTKLTDGAQVTVDEVAVSMTYGQDDSARVIEDFSPEALVGKVVGAEGEALKQRLLLRQRLQSQVVEQLLGQLNDPRFSGQLDDPARRQAVLAELDKRIAELEAVKAELELRHLEGGS